VTFGCSQSWTEKASTRSKTMTRRSSVWTRRRCINRNRCWDGVAAKDFSCRTIAVVSAHPISSSVISTRWSTKTWSLNFYDNCTGQLNHGDNIRTICSYELVFLITALADLRKFYIVFIRKKFSHTYIQYCRPIIYDRHCRVLIENLNFYFFGGVRTV